MKKKSIETMCASQILLNNNKSTPSVHCSYYAVFQYMKYMLSQTTDRPIPYENQQSDNLGVHDFVIGEIKNRINNRALKRQFCDGIRELKQARVQADYLEKEFSLEEGLRCKQNAEGLITNLKTDFGNI